MKFPWRIKKNIFVSCILGMFAPTSGRAIVNGRDINTDLEGVRRDLGLCPQHNMLFDKLTVEEHLIFFARVSFPIVQTSSFFDGLL